MARSPESAKTGRKKAQASAEKPAAGGKDASPTVGLNGNQKVEVKTLVKPISNAINILRFLSTQGQFATTTQIARHLEINASTCFNILRTLAYEGVIEFDSVSKAYRIGLELGKIAGNALHQGDRVAATRPVLHAFAEEFGLTMALWRRVGVDRMVLTIVERSSGAFSIAMREGQRLPVLLGASGRLMATQMGLTKREVQKEFKALRWARRPDFEAFWAESLEADAAGWATDRANFAAGVQTIAVPVYEPGGRIAFTAVAFVFLGQYEDTRITEIGHALKTLGERLSRIIY